MGHSLVYIDTISQYFYELNNLLQTTLSTPSMHYNYKYRYRSQPNLQPN